MKDIRYIEQEGRIYVCDNMTFAMMDKSDLPYNKAVMLYGIPIEKYINDKVKKEKIKLLDKIMKVPDDCEDIKYSRICNLYTVCNKLMRNKK